MKIPAQELRIGNLVQSEANGGYKIHKVDLVSEPIIGFDNFTLISTGLIPIPLTDEWLMKLKGKNGICEIKTNPRTRRCIVWNCFGIEIRLNTENGIVTLLRIRILGQDTDVELCQYVHQLQNLYWCLRGEELTIKE